MIELIIQIEQSEYRHDALKHDNIHQWTFHDEMVRIERVTAFNGMKTGGLKVGFKDADTITLPGRSKECDPPIDVVSGTAYDPDQ